MVRMNVIYSLMWSFCYMSHLPSSMFLIHRSLSPPTATVHRLGSSLSSAASVLAWIENSKEKTNIHSERICMDRKLFQAATDGELEVFREKVSELQLLLTPERNTVLHVHIITTSRTLIKQPSWKGS
ncbi:uncharacterized protein LOC133834257 [Humulus lupulus]|uniref:uncharacterized protein LOC133834237 n=1 Tax=Humulus lupulus TaxID=3486 RepID=UPI002B406422|nr:uncharacterized protein LOC133834237 [Humulus lupulus]XP_062119762.1 uncharacterized protein LOC133834239 [Humulus lupulus]XP_062119796.1 uncharacterized protein LOC133834257 [Humulus lupulus]